MQEAIKKLKKIKAKRIFVQFPEGLKLKIQDVAKELEKNGFEVVLCMEPTYGACDIREYEATLLNCDAILHIGHEDYGIKTELPVVYYPFFLNGNPIKILEKEWSKLEKYKRIGLVTSLQFIPAMLKAKKFLENKGKKVLVGKSATEKYEGQILGCRIGAGKQIEKKVDVFLCISAGKFYPLGLALATEKPVLNLDLETGKIHSLEELKKKIKKIEVWNLAQFKEAKKIGFLVSWKRGQMFGLPFELKKRVEKEGKEVYILAMDEINEEKLQGLKLDVLVNFACPRIGSDDLERFKIPLINYNLLYQKNLKAQKV
ncbi:MAG: diphthamide biosynthesis enzyme Dph2 [Candidatus Aenigmatarchaeota archaeon]